MPSQGLPPVVVSSVVAVSLDVSLVVSALDELVSVLDSVVGPDSEVVGLLVVSVLELSTLSLPVLEFESADSVISSCASALSPIVVELLATSSFPPSSSPQADAPARTSRQERLSVDGARSFTDMATHDSVEALMFEGLTA